MEFLKRGSRMTDQYMKTLFEVYVSNYELPSRRVVDSIGDLEWTIDKLFSYGTTKEHVADFVASQWDGEDSEWQFSDSDPFTILVAVHRESEIESISANLQEPKPAPSGIMSMADWNSSVLANYRSKQS